MLEASLRLALTTNFPVLSITGEIEALLGFKPEDFLAAKVSVRTLIHAHDLDIADELFTIENYAAEASCNIRLRQANGLIRCVKIYYTKNTAEDGVDILEWRMQDSKSLRQRISTSPLVDNFKAMMDNTDDYIYFKDRNHVFTGASKTLIDNTEPLEPSSDLLGLTDYDVFPEEYADSYYQLEKEVFASGQAVYEIQQYQAKDGKKGWIDNRKYPIKDEKGIVIGLYGIARDITERKRAEEALQENERKLRGLFKLSPLGIAMTDMEGQFIEFNETFMQICGYTQQELRALDYWELTPQKYAYAEAQQLGKLAVTGKYGPYEKEYLRKDGSLIPICLNGVLIKGKDGRDYIWSMIEDIRERRQSEKQLLENKAQLSELLEIQTAILDALPVNIALIDPQGRIQATNWHWDAFALDNDLPSATVRTYSYDLNICYNSTGIDTESSPCLVEGIYHVLDGNKFHFTHHAAHTGLLAVLRGEQKSFSLEYANLAADQLRWFRMLVTPLNELGGSVVVSHENITERRRQEEQSKAHLDELAHVTRLGLMGQMASGLAHEINQPLSAIASYTQASINMFKAEKPNLELLSEIADKTKQQALRAGQIVHRMRDFIKFKANPNTVVDLNSLILDAVGLCQADIKQNNIKLDCNLKNDLPLVNVDPIQIEQVLINLIRNSIDALQNLSVDQQRSLSIHNELMPENSIQVRVKDNGPGITAEQQKKIFMPFYTTKTSGLGMGLSICRSLIEAHGGVLRFKSSVGRGATFYFTLKPGITA